MTAPHPSLLRALLLAALVAFARPAAAVTLPSGFQETVVFSGLEQPTAVEFASDGRVFVAEKSGIIKVFDGLTDPTPTTFADLRTTTHNYWDRGLLGLALHPDFPVVPYVYALYTHDAPIGGTAPAWGSFGGTSDGCPEPLPGGANQGCVVSGRVVRMTASGNVAVGTPQVLVENWCQQFPSHSIGTIAFGPDGALYVSGGDGANFNFVDYGQYGYPLQNPCGDPPHGVGGPAAPPSAEGGALRSQDLRTGGDPVSYDGTVLRLDPITGASLPDNPLAGGADASDDPIIAYGLRNPFRLAARPGTSEIWIGDVGWNTWEEIDRIGDAHDTVIENFGWPCYEGPARQGGFDAPNLTLCENLYAVPGAVTDGHFSYRHADTVVAGDACGAGGSSISGLAFYRGGTYPAGYTGALFFSDFSRRCIWAMPLGGDGDPDPAAQLTFAVQASDPVELDIGPDGDLFYVSLGGTIRRIHYVATSQPPTAIATADVANGPTPLTVQFDGSASSDPDLGDTLAFAWDLDGDGAFDDASSPAPLSTYPSPGTSTVRLRVTDPHGVSDVATLQITAGNSAPTATIATPTAGTTWRVGGTVAFSGIGVDPEQGTLPESALTWTLVIQHCPSTCHAHTVQTFSGASGSFTAPDHDYPTYLELRLTATDAGGLAHTTSLVLDPETTDLTFASTPPGLTLAVGAETATTPFTRRGIVGSRSSVAAPTPQELAGLTWSFASWSDGGPASHDVVAPAGNATYTTTFVTPCDQSCDDADTCTNDACEPEAGCVHAPVDCDDGNACTVDACADDGCTHPDVGAPFDRRPSLRITGIGKPGAQKMTLRGGFLLPVPITPPLDPTAHGLVLELADRTGAVRERFVLPPDARWTANGKGTAWRFVDPTGAVGGIDSVTLKVTSAGEVSVKLRARRATYDLATGDAPIALRLSVGTPSQCTALQFAGITGPGPGCRFNGSGTTLACR